MSIDIKEGKKYKDISKTWRSSGCIIKIIEIEEDTFSGYDRIWFKIIDNTNAIKEISNGRELYIPDGKLNNQFQPLNNKIKKL